MSQQISIERFLSDAKPQFDRLQDFYRHAQFVGHSRFQNSTQVSGSEVLQHTYHSNGAHLRVDTLVHDRRPSSGRAWVEWSRVATPHMGFDASRSEGDAGFVLRSFSRDATKNDTSIRWQYPFASSTYQYRELTLWEFLSDPVVKITSCDAIRRNRENLIYLQCRREGVETQAFTFSVDKAWAMVDSWIGTDERRDCTHVDYEMVNGYPIVRRLDDYRQYSNGKVPMRTIVEVSDFIPAAAPLAHFDMSALGIHDALPTKDFIT